VDSAGVRQWGSYGTAVCTASGTQENPTISINNDRIIIVWDDSRNGNYDIYANSININGMVLWNNNGIYICDTINAQTHSKNKIVIWDDSAAIITWDDNRRLDWDEYAQKVDIDGNKLWGNQGIALCDTSGVQGAVCGVSDNMGGGIISWIDSRNNARDIYVQRIDSNGGRRWETQGNCVCSADSSQQSQDIISDNSSGAIVCWQDKRSGMNHIYAQHVDSSGSMKWQVNGMPVCLATPYGQEYPLMIPSDSGTAIIVWNDGRNGWGRGYAQRVGDDPDGVSGDAGCKMQNARCRLEQNVPNPFSQLTIINYQLVKSGRVRLTIYNVAGQLVRTLVDEDTKMRRYETSTGSGTRSVTWDGRNDDHAAVPSGIYFCRMTTGNGIRQTVKMIKLK
jgi:hypothetical protein